MPDASLLLDPDHRFRRMHQVLLVAGVALGMAALYRLASGSHGIVFWVMVGTLGLLGVARWLLQQGRADAAATVMLGALTGMLSYFMVRGAGLRDVALLGYPGILVFTALLGNRRLFIALLATCLVVCVGVGLATVLGWRDNTTRPLTMPEVMDVCVILVASSLSIGLMANDLGRALKRLAYENAAVREQQRRIEYLASHDTLTGLPNRLAARDRFVQAASLAARQGGKVALLYLDLDHFKNVNDSLGHPAGDQLLRAMAARLAPLLRGSDALSRLGGDEFLALQVDAQDADHVAALARRLLEAVAEPLPLQGLEVHGGASIGIALYPDDGNDFDSLMKKADIAMYRAKSAGRNAFRFFDAQMNASVAEHLQMVDWIRQGLQRGEFELHYQPQVELGSGRVIGAEALLRWRHPERGPISPAQFIPVAEHSGQIVELGNWVLREACRTAAGWREAGLGELVISVNLSPVQARRGDLEAAVHRALFDAGLPPQLLELELTETMLIEETETLRAMLARLRAMGIAFSIDDFGTGYSNLAYLKRFEVERLKIDQSFIRRLTQNAEDDAIVRAILQMAQALRLGVIAEGVEDAATLARLQALGCPLGQGYHWAPALPADRFEAFVRERQASLV
ncbi:putative bifunctional diguanylate cyclase/phosphodiesterase [Aquabacterium sp.]|uniref:putative bifunctional diguanylate cyclase/phosphodiesterase n=1 Tax=Aquabacterium sp. TaxID=1872578 RepID=UPI00378328B4